MITLLDFFSKPSKKLGIAQQLLMGCNESILKSRRNVFSQSLQPASGTRRAKKSIRPHQHVALSSCAFLKSFVFCSPQSDSKSLRVLMRWCKNPKP